MRHRPRQFQKIHHPVSPDVSTGSRFHAGRLFVLTQKIRRHGHAIRLRGRCAKSFFSFA
jgi:hypothetical protein